jgi:type II secretion system protein J
MKTGAFQLYLNGRWSYRRAFTLVEMMIAIAILSIILAAIYSTWTAILRSAKVGLDAAASVQRARIAVRMLEDSLTSAQSFTRNPQFYGFVAENGSEPILSFVARVSKSFPRSGKFGDLDLRRITFTIDGDRQLVLRQNPVLMELDEDEKKYPLVLVKNVKEFSLQFWDQRLKDWTDEWTQTNTLPKLVTITLKVADNGTSAKSDNITRIISIPSQAVPGQWQTPAVPGLNPGITQTNTGPPPPPIQQRAP